MARKPVGFVDKHRQITDPFYELCNNLGDSNPIFIKKQLQRFIQEDPDFLESYLLLSEILFEEGKVDEGEGMTNTAFTKAIKMITDKNGNWPEVLEWGWLENRHIIKAILNKALSYWVKGETDEALDLFRKLLSTNPGDNPGVRYYILAIKQGMSYREFEKRFDEGGYFSSKLDHWFEKNYKKFPEEFGWWEKAMEEYL